MKTGLHILSADDKPTLPSKFKSKLDEENKKNQTKWGKFKAGVASFDFSMIPIVWGIAGGVVVLIMVNNLVTEHRSLPEGLKDIEQSYPYNFELDKPDFF